MKLSSFKQVQEIDENIQQLLGDLSELYKIREQLYAESSTKGKQRHVTRKSLEKLDLSQFDLSLRD